ncbi:hypothetical protein GCM10017562_03390 [Streptomyces roseofulvus]
MEAARAVSCLGAAGVRADAFTGARAASERSSPPDLAGRRAMGSGVPVSEFDHGAVVRGRDHGIGESG